MKAYLAFVRAVNWLTVIGLSIAAVLWYTDVIPRDILTREPAARPEQPAKEAPKPEEAKPGNDEAAPGKAAPAPEVGQAPAGSQTQTIDDVREYAFFGGVILLALNFLGLIARLRGTVSPHYLIFEKEGAGSLKVAVDAIEDTLTKSTMSIPEVQEAKIEMILDKGGKMPRRATAHCIFSDVPNLFAVQENVRQILTGRYQEIFPNEDLQFEIIVDRLKGQEPPRQRKKPSAPGKPEGEQAGNQAGFGPKYPVEK